MPMTGVLRPGHVQIRVLDIEESVRWYSEVLGLLETGRDKFGRVYFKCWDERDHHSVILRKADRAGMDFLGFKVLDVATLNRLEANLKAYGVTTERMPAGDLLETGERVRFKLPTQHTIELYAHKKDVGNGMSYVNPDPWTKDAERGIAPMRMDHCLMFGKDIDGVRKLTEDVLGFSLVEHVLMEDGKTDLGVWMTCSTKVHDFAIVRHSEDDKLHHIAFLLDSWERVLRAADIMSMHRTPLDLGPTRHGITRGTTIYFFDPSGNRMETFCGGYQWYPDMQPLTWTFEELGPAIFYHDRKLNERFLSVVT